MTSSWVTRSARGIALFPDEYGVGVIAVGRDSHGIASNREMPAGEAID